MDNVQHIKCETTDCIHCQDGSRTNEDGVTIREQLHLTAQQHKHIF